MLTFEEFFKKKRIDLQQLQQAEPSLFVEFSKHYPLMGEKSFDHTKKYWFNNLRRLYPLATEAKPHKVQAEAISQTAVQGVAVAAAQNVDAGIERPKFKEDNLPFLTEENVSDQDISLTEIEKSIIENHPVTNLEGATAKPTFKPRFNAKNIKKPEAEKEVNLVKSEEEKIDEREPAKPAFKPRFNMQNIKKDVVKEASETEAEMPEPEVEIKPEPATENPQPEPAKPAFKPRFNMQNIKKDVVKEASETEKKVPELATENPQPKTEEAKPVYKPRFQMKNKPKPAAENPPKNDD
ncbi:hypothetical protein [uncultured Mucilaginibacter sp.]|uniref:hypothetical protein n=1 Tax=uncultured Mucilaginibacter sp. TaxID=797541 RepID=UPI002625AC14|nr:hypothetical protein [uncultured Mucilaginibacter sp.]